MRRAMVLGVAGLGLLALAACQKKDGAGAPAAGETAKPAAASAPMAAPAAPKRKSGLWAISTSAMGRAQTIKTCVDSAQDAEMAAWGQEQGDKMCSQHSYAPIPGGWKFDSVCEMPGGSGKITSSGTATGDFSSKYTVKVHSTTEGSSMPQANGTHDMEMSAVWEGPCPADMKPGDVAVNGMKFNPSAMVKGK